LSFQQFSLKQQLTEIYNSLPIRIGLVLILIAIGYPSAAQNLIINGSMDCGVVRSDTVAPGWYKYPNQPLVNNTPDINSDSGIAHIDPGWEWCCGTPVASPDGGTWQNVWRVENFAQTIYGLTVGTTYYFRYYYASQGISNSVGLPSGYDTGDVARLPYPPDVTIIGAMGYANPSASKLFEWNTYSGSLVATSDSITIICSEGKYEGYIAYDGFYLGTNQPDNFLDVSSPDSVILCNSGNASFTVQSATGITYQWQSGHGYIWENVNDGGGVTGAHTNTLSVSNVTSALNQTQYRCLVTSSCCNAASAPALLTVAPLPKPALKISTDEPDICGSTTSIIIYTDSFYRDYLWNDNSKNQSILATQPNIYWVQVTDSNNCMGRDSIQILPCEKMVVPNAFTPNGDGINDVFKPAFYGNVVNYSLTIYNRWGQMIFKSNDPGKGWDGTTSGVSAPDDTYVWNCQFQLQGYKPDHKDGTVVLFR
jgi:gliding motility-associated-like protein